MTTTSVPLSEPLKKIGNNYTQYFELFLLIKGLVSLHLMCIKLQIFSNPITTTVNEHR